jgi:hypothetical protein
MEKQIKVNKDKKGNLTFVYSYELDEEALMERKAQIEKAIKAYDYQLKGMMEARQNLQAELDAINANLAQVKGGS